MQESVTDISCKIVYIYEIMKLYVYYFNYYFIHFIMFSINYTIQI